MKTVLTAGAAVAAASAFFAMAAVPTAASAQSIPQGSYERSCRDVSIRSDVLHASCRTDRGDWNRTILNMRTCDRGDVANRNGILVCDNRGGWGYRDRDRDRDWGRDRDRDNRWGGGWGGRDSITVYRDANYRGASRSFNGEIADLQREGFNDSISSMSFRGSWEACTDAYFRGRCQIFQDDVANLQWQGMNDRISSLRPARGGGWR